MGGGENSTISVDEDILPRRIQVKISATENTSYNNEEVVRNGLGQDGYSIKRPPLFSLFTLVVDGCAQQHVINIL